MRRITLALTFAIIATLVGSSVALAHASGGSQSQYCGSSLGPAGQLVPLYDYIVGRAPDMPAISDIPVAQLQERGIGVVRSQYTNPTGWPYSAPVLTLVSSDRSVLVFRFDCGALVYSAWSVSALTLGATEQPNGGMASMLSRTGRVLLVELDPRLIKPGVIITLGIYGSAPRTTNGIRHFETFPVEEYQVLIKPLGD